MIYNLEHNSYNQFSFGSRAPQIRDCQWVCHCVNTVMPHFSTTKAKPSFVKKIASVSGNEECVPEKFSITDVYEILSDLPLTGDDIKCLPFIERVKTRLQRFCLSRQTKKDIKVLAAIRENIADFGKKRMECDVLFHNDTKSALRMLSLYKLGNCYEDAILAKIILELNGINNAKVIKITNDLGKINHAVCAYNKDGSPIVYKKRRPEVYIDEKNTIFIDPWAGKADFASNMLLHYKNVMQEHFIVSGSKLKFVDLDVKPAPKETINSLKLEFPSFIYPNGKRKFMQTK